MRFNTRYGDAGPHGSAARSIRAPAGAGALRLPSYAQAPAQTPGPPDPSRQSREAAADGVAALLNRLELLLQQNNRDDFPSLLSTPDITGQEAEQATDDLFSYETTSARPSGSAIERRSKARLPGDGYHVIVEILTETTARARVLTARFDLRRPRDGPVDSWRIVAITRLTYVQGLYRLRLDSVDAVRRARVHDSRAGRANSRCTPAPCSR